MRVAPLFTLVRVGPRRLLLHLLQPSPPPQLPRQAGHRRDRAAQRRQIRAREPPLREPVRRRDRRRRRRDYEGPHVPGGEFHESGLRGD